MSPRKRSLLRTCATARPVCGQHGAGAAAPSVKLSVDHGAFGRSAGNREPRYQDRRDGLRGNAWTRRPSERCGLHRPDNRKAAARNRTGGDTGGECQRIGPYSAQFQERTVSKWTGQLERKGRTKPEGSASRSIWEAMRRPRRRPQRPRLQCCMRPICSRRASGRHIWTRSSRTCSAGCRKCWRCVRPT